MNEKAVAWSILIVLISVTAGAYLLAWRGRRLAHRRVASFALATVSALAGFVGTFGYAVPALDDLHNAAVSLRTAVIGNLILWAICIGAWLIAIRFTISGLRKHSPNKTQ